MSESDSQSDDLGGLELMVPGIRQRAADLFSIGEELRKESDRGCALVAAAYLENEVSHLLSVFFVPQSSADAKALFGFSGPVGTFSAKTRLAVALGLIPREIGSSLDDVRSLRNDFAHLHEPLTFASDKIQQRLRGLISALPEEREKVRAAFIAEVQNIATSLHIHIANTQRRTSPAYEPVALRADAEEHALEVAARHMMQITAPDITYEQALDMARAIRKL